MAKGKREKMEMKKWRLNSKKKKKEEKKEGIFVSLSSPSLSLTHFLSHILTLFLPISASPVSSTPPHLQHCPAAPLLAGHYCS